MKYLSAACCIAVVALVMFVLLRDRFHIWRLGHWLDRGQARTTVCIDCGGTGWIHQRERTLRFTGDSFADVEGPASMCPACGGTGQVTH